MDAIQKLEAQAKKLILTKLAAALQSLAVANAPQPIQRVAEPDPEEEQSIQRVNLSYHYHVHQPYYSTDPQGKTTHTPT